MIKNRLENVKITREEYRNVLDFISEESNIEDIRGLIKWLGCRDKHVKDTVLKYEKYRSEYYKNISNCSYGHMQNINLEKLKQILLDEVKW